MTILHGYCKTWRLLNNMHRNTFWRYLSSKVDPAVKVKPIQSVLIANRGEIACRIIRTAKKMGLRTIAVYSQPDVSSLHVSMADEAILLGPAAASQSYLNQSKIIDAARVTGADAIHPGYGFLSENAEFASLCQSSNVTFIGPPADAIRKMGVKSEAKEIMSKAGVPVIVGYHGSNQDDSFLRQEASKIGYPIMIKAVKGGGGKGMRICFSDKDFEEMLSSARRESSKSFGDDSVLIEKFVSKPRHVEVQVFGDLHGNYVYLFERDCSVQRRHQKILEEAPAPGITSETRRQLGLSAVKAAAAVNYVGAGTVEFILDETSNPGSSDFFFMEMNTRLQVEHPVTEYITQTDLVEWQLRVASGETLPMTQEQLGSPVGHAFEARVYAEDTSNGAFMPAPGPLKTFFMTDDVDVRDASIRVETGVTSGDEVSVHYDPMIAKLVVWDVDREKSLRKLQRTLEATRINGVKTNIDFLIRLLGNKDLREGKVNTDFIEDHRDQVLSPVTPSNEIIAAAAVGRLIMLLNSYQDKCHSFPSDYDSFRVSSSSPSESISFKFNEEDDFHVTLGRVSGDGFKFSVSVNGKSVGVIEGSLDDVTGQLVITKDGHRKKYGFLSTSDSCKIFTGACDLNSVTLDVMTPSFLTDSVDGVAGGTSTSGRVTSPMPGVIEHIFVKEGDKVKAGDSLLTLIAMKMEYTLKSPGDGIVESLSFQVGNNVSKGAVLLVIK